MTALPSIGECVQFACILEATARKPGNVTRFHDFSDLTYLDFLLSAAVSAPVFDRVAELGVGRTVLEAVRATRRVVKTNTNLGIMLLLAPLAAVRESMTRTKIEAILDTLTVDDSCQVFEAIQLANPGGLGDAPKQDVRGEPTLPLRQVMALAADRDLIARQYANGYREVFEIGVPALGQAPLEKATIRCHLKFLAAVEDTHIARRCGQDVAAEAKRRAGEVLASGWPDSLDGKTALDEFDAWLRADGHRRNPGSIADLVAASLFVALRSGRITFPIGFS